jgi:hypothetical protein
MGFGIKISPATQRQATLAYKSPLVNPYGLGKSLLKALIENNINPLC